MVSKLWLCDNDDCGIPVTWWEGSFPKVLVENIQDIAGQNPNKYICEIVVRDVIKRLKACGYKPRDIGSTTLMQIANDHGITDLFSEFSPNLDDDLKPYFEDMNIRYRIEPLINGYLFPFRDGISHPTNDHLSYIVVTWNPSMDQTFCIVISVCLRFFEIICVWRCRDTDGDDLIEEEREENIVESNLMKEEEREEEREENIVISRWWLSDDVSSISIKWNSSELPDVCKNIPQIAGQNPYRHAFEKCVIELFKRFQSCISSLGNHDNRTLVYIGITDLPEFSPKLDDDFERYFGNSHFRCRIISDDSNDCYERLKNKKVIISFNSSPDQSLLMTMLVNFEELKIMCVTQCENLERIELPILKLHVIRQWLLSDNIPQLKWITDEFPYDLENVPSISGKNPYRMAFEGCVIQILKKIKSSGRRFFDLEESECYFSHKLEKFSDHPGFDILSEFSLNFDFDDDTKNYFENTNMHFRIMPFSSGDNQSDEYDLCQQANLEYSRFQVWWSSSSMNQTFYIVMEVNFIEFKIFGARQCFFHTDADVTSLIIPFAPSFIENEFDDELFNELYNEEVQHDVDEDQESGEEGYIRQMGTTDDSISHPIRWVFDNEFPSDLGNVPQISGINPYKHAFEMCVIEIIKHIKSHGYRPIQRGYRNIPTATPLLTLTTLARRHGITDLFTEFRPKIDDENIKSFFENMDIRCRIIPVYFGHQACVDNSWVVVSWNSPSTYQTLHVVMGVSFMSYRIYYLRQCRDQDGEFVEEEHNFELPSVIPRYIMGNEIKCPFCRQTTDLQSANTEVKHDTCHICSNDQTTFMELGCCKNKMCESCFTELKKYD